MWETIGGGVVIVFMLGWLSKNSVNLSKKVHYKTCEEKRDEINGKLNQGEVQFMSIKKDLEHIMIKLDEMNGDTQ